MPEKIECDSHGKTDCTYVCPHLLQSLKDSKPSGFHWIQDSEDEIQAFCDRCWHADDEEWEEISAAGCRILCLECLKSVAELNDVEMAF
ncbi:MAG: hypothetical protein ACR2O3_04615 [Rhizobiaceae bacterium]